MEVNEQIKLANVGLTHGTPRGVKIGLAEWALWAETTLQLAYPIILGATTLASHEPLRAS